MQRVDTDDPGARLRFWSAVSTVALAVLSSATAVTTPPRSGPNCRHGCIGYPYVDAAAYVPRDYVWMYPALLMPVALTVLVWCLHVRVPPDRRPFSGAAVCLVVTASGVLVVDYALQLTVAQTALVTGETAGLSLLSQYNPHGVFIGLENVGYAMTALGLVLLGTALTGTVSRRLRWAATGYRVGGGVVLALLVGYAVRYRHGLDYRFEVVALLVTWLVLIGTGTLIALDARPFTDARSPARRPTQVRGRRGAGR